MYHYTSKRAARTGGIVLGAVLGLIFSLPALAATTTATTGGVSAMSSTSATLSGSYDIGAGTNGGADTWFQWGATTAMSAQTPIAHYGATSGSLSATLSGLSSGTTYYYRAVANNPTLGPGYGVMRSFTTTSTVNIKAKVLTMGATPASTTAVLSGYFSGNDGTLSTEFAYGSSASNLSTETGFVPQTDTSSDYSTTITGLTPNTTYYYEAIGQDLSGNVYGSAIPFTTSPASGGGGGGSSACTIDSFQGSPASISSGSSSTLSWSTTGCSSVALSGGIYANTAESGTSASTGSITLTTTYTLVGTAADGSTSPASYTTVYVAPNGGGGSGSACTLGSFYASPTSVTYGNSTTLYWNTTNCTTLSVTPDIGAVATGSGTIQTGSLYETTAYTLTGTDSLGNQTSIATTVSASPSNGGGGSTSTYCAVNSFYGTPTAIQNGQSATLDWSTTGCSSVAISGGSLGGYSNLAANGSLPTGALYGTTLFTLTANGANSASSSTSISVIGSQYPYTYQCSDGIDNDGNGLIDYPNDPGCYSPYDNSESSDAGNGTQAGAASVVSLPASNIGSGTTRLNGIVLGSTSPVNAYFEYGPDITLGGTTALQTVAATGNLSYFDTINVLPARTYYYRAVVQVNGVVIRGSIMSFVTPQAQINAPVYVNTGFGSSSTTYVRTQSTSTSSADSQTAPAQNGITLTITDKGDMLQIGDTADYTVAYANGSDKRLTDVTLSVVLPQGMTLLQTTQGRMTSPSTIEVDLGTLAPGQSGSIFLQANVGASVTTQDTLVTNGTLSYTYPNGTRDSTIGYVLNHASGSSFLGGIALGSGFFPTTILGWFITILIILALILVVRRVVKGADAGHGGHGAHH